MSAAHTTSPGDERPRLTMLLIAYEQASTIAAAIQGALAQTYSPLEIVISDDASGDGTFAAIQAAVADYRGPHRLLVNRNPRNLGVGGNLNRAVELSTGELLVVTAGDDVSLPQRCERLAEAWLAAGRRPDLLSSSLVDLDAKGQSHATIVPTDLGAYRNAADWIARPPHVIGAAQAWTRRLVDRFGPFPPGTVAEDLLMVFRAIVSGGALTLAEPLVQYRRGGISRKRRNLHARDVVERLLKNNRHALVELPQLLADAERAGQRPAIEAEIGHQLARERFVQALFGATGLAGRWCAVRSATAVPPGQRLRLFVYAACPALLAPGFALKRWARRAPAGAKTSS